MFKFRLIIFDTPLKIEGWNRIMEVGVGVFCDGNRVFLLQWGHFIR